MLGCELRFDGKLLLQAGISRFEFWVSQRSAPLTFNEGDYTGPRP